MNSLRFAAQVLVAAMFFIIAILLIPLAAAHGLANWIMDDPRTAFCCGPIDCAVAASGEIIRVRGGWLHVPTESFIEDGSPFLFQSIDSQTWRCVRGDFMRCLFLPVGA